MNRFLTNLLCMPLMLAIPLAFSQGTGSGYTIVTDLVLVHEDDAANIESEAQLGDWRVIDRANLRILPASASNSIITDRRGQPLALIRESITGRYATTDGSLIVSARDQSMIGSVASKYGLDVDYVFGAVPMAKLSAPSLKSALSLIETLRNDIDVLHVQLNTNFYDRRAQ